MEHKTESQEQAMHFDLRVSPYIFLLAVAGSIVIFDQVTKALVIEKLTHGREQDLLGGAVRLVYSTNTGAAFSMFSSGGSLFIGVAVIAIVGIVWYLPRLPATAVIARFAFSSILAGAAGNLIDRIRLGHVIDFIDLGWWPVFNLADSALVIGVSLLIVIGFVPPSTRLRQ
jgi:signal peptidase II